MSRVRSPSPRCYEGGPMRGPTAARSNEPIAPRLPPSLQSPPTPYRPGSQAADRSAPRLAPTGLASTSSPRLTVSGSVWQSPRRQLPMLNVAASIPRRPVFIVRTGKALLSSLSSSHFITDPSNKLFGGSEKLGNSLLTGVVANLVAESTQILVQTTKLGVAQRHHPAAGVSCEVEHGEHCSLIAPASPSRHGPKSRRHPPGETPSAPAATSKLGRGQS